jgi:hypothetical protein
MHAKNFINTRPKENILVQEKKKKGHPSLITKGPVTGIFLYLSSNNQRCIQSYIVLSFAIKGEDFEKGHPVCGHIKK